MNDQHEITKILVLGYVWDMSAKIFVGNFQNVLDKDFFSITLMPIHMIDRINLTFWDVFIFSRSSGQESYSFQKRAMGMGKPVIYMLDDDLLGLHESEQFRAFSPGTIAYETTKQQIIEADLVITFSRVVTEVVSLLNTNVITLRTNILSKYLDDDFVAHSFEEPLRVIYAGTPTKNEEFMHLWPAIQRFSEEQGNQVEFHFWGMDINQFPPLKSRVYMQQFIQSYNFNYDDYIKRLKRGKFHIMIAPLFDRIRAQRAKCPIKYLEATAGGCLGIFSDVFPYQDIRHEETGIKTSNTVEAWLNSFRWAFNLDNKSRMSIWEEARKHILSDLSTESQIDTFITAIDEAKNLASMRCTSNSRGD